MPEIKQQGTNTAIRTRDVATTAPVISSIEIKVASLGLLPISMCLCTFSTTTMLSSTTVPTASTKPNNVSVFIEKPQIANIARVPRSDTGIETNGTIEALQSPKNKYTTRVTRITARTMAFTTSSRDSLMVSVVSVNIFQYPYVYYIWGGMGFVLNKSVKSVYENR